MGDPINHASLRSAKPAEPRRVGIGPWPALLASGVTVGPLVSIGLLLAVIGTILAGCSAATTQTGSPQNGPQQYRTIQCRDLRTGAISGHMGTAPECDPGQEEVWSDHAGETPLSAPRLAAIAPPGISFARYCFDLATLIARGRDSQCQSDAVDLTLAEYEAIARKEINERITAYQVAGWPAHKEKPHATPAAIVGTAVSISNGGVYVTRFGAIEGCKELSLNGQIADVIAVDAEDDVAALVSGARTGVVASFRAGPPRRHGEPILALDYVHDSHEGAIFPAHMPNGDETTAEAFAMIEGAQISPGDGALLLDRSGNTAGIVFAAADGPPGTVRYMTAEGLTAILDFWGLPYQTAESVAAYSDDEVSRWEKSMAQPIGCWRKP